MVVVLRRTSRVSHEYVRHPPHPMTDATVNGDDDRGSGQDLSSRDTTIRYDTIRFENRNHIGGSVVEINISKSNLKDFAL